MTNESMLNKENLNNDYFKLKYGIINKTYALKDFFGDRRNPKHKKYFLGDYDYLNKLSIDLKKYVESLIPYSFGLKISFKLKAPYFSKDDDEFYIVQNPVLKEKVFKVPMIRGSGWKGALLKSAIELLKTENSPEILGSIFRIFGVGNKEYRELFDNNDKVIEEKLKIFLALEMGYCPDEDIDTQIKKYFETKAKKGRAVFYPTYFDTLSLEIINPHDRRKRAGTNPIHYEVVPKTTEGIFQLIYIPFDGVIKSDNELKAEVKKDLEILCNTLEVLSDNGIGAKTKLGWGRFEITDKKVCVNKNMDIPEGWEKCQ